VAKIRAVGPGNVVLSSDLGQVGNPVHTDGFTAFLPRLREAGFSDDEIDAMTRRNPARLLGLD
jgi:predicted metal-dependent phosphotriesterase family hydrolase